MSGKKKSAALSFSKTVVTMCIAFITAYTVVNMLLFWLYQAEPQYLHKYVFGFFGGELLLLCAKRILTGKASGTSPASGASGAPPDEMDEADEASEAEETEADEDGGVG